MKNADESANVAARKVLGTAAQLLDANLISEEDFSAVLAVSKRYAVGVSAQMVRQIRPGADADPVAAQFIPAIEELTVSKDESADPIGDAAHSPAPGIVHRYPDRVLLKPLHSCAVYCRFCFRREVVGPGNAHLNDAELDVALDYIASHEEIWEVVITGGDPLLLSPRRLGHILQRLQAIVHVGVVRFHTRIPVVRPDLVTDELVRALRIRKAVYVMLHINHVQELSEEARLACERLIDAGIPMLSQTVLLNGINADAPTLEALFRTLVAMRIKPCYLHHGDLATGTGHFRTTIALGQELMRELRGRVSGLCQPHYLLDIPGGFGKVPIGPVYAAQRDDGSYVVQDYQGAFHDYPAGC